MNETTERFTTGRAVIKKDREKGNDVTNFGSITCLPLMCGRYSLEYLATNYFTIR